VAKAPTKNNAKSLSVLLKKLSNITTKKSELRQQNKNFGSEKQELVKYNLLIV